MQQEFDRFWIAGADLSADATTALLVGALAAQGVCPIVLKGPSTRHWSRRGDVGHFSVDIDLLIDPAGRQSAEIALRGLGYEPIPDADHPGYVRPTHAIVWNHPTLMQVDLHETLVGVTVPASEAWRVLAAERDRIEVAGTSIDVLSERGRALHLALHAAQHGQADRRRIGALTSAVEELSLETWRGAAELAERLGATEALASGLSLTPQGSALSSRLGLPETTSASVELRRRTAPQFAHALEWLATRPGVRARVAFAVSRLFPPRAWMRLELPEGQRGNLRLAAAYVRRLFRLAAGLAPAFTVWARARRAAGRSRTS
jgi:hypothetical protein